MNEKRYILSHNGKEDGILDKTNDKGYYGFELARLVNELSEENEQLKQSFDKSLLNHTKTCDEYRILSKKNKRLKEENKQLKKENENLNNVLEDFMVMLNKLQAEPNNKSLPLMARDMLRMMGKDIMGDSE